MAPLLVCIHAKPHRWPMVCPVLRPECKTAPLPILGLSCNHVPDLPMGCPYRKRYLHFDSDAQMQTWGREGGSPAADLPCQKHEHPAGCSPEIGRGRDHGLPLTLTRARRTKDQNGLFLLSHRGEIIISSLPIVILFSLAVLRGRGLIPGHRKSGVIAPSHLPSTKLQEKSNQIRFKTCRLSQKYMQP
jgi:hypothetical protein